jgi:arsenite/tail-anchored protein-transporting ATPase
VRRILTDGATTSVRLVVNPERMVISEAMRTFTYLNLFGYRVDAVIANRLLPETVTDPYFDRWKQLQAQHLETIHTAFSPVPILHARLREQELAGAELLAELGAEMYGDVDANDVLFSDEPMTITRRGSAYVLALRLPFARRDELDLSVKGDELFVRVGSYRRTLVLPRVLSTRALSSAKLVDDRVEISFQRKQVT